MIEAGELAKCTLWPLRRGLSTAVLMGVSAERGGVVDGGGGLCVGGGGEPAPMAAALDECSLLTMASVVSLEPAWKWRLAGLLPEISMKICLPFSVLIESIASESHFCTGVWRA